VGQSFLAESLDPTEGSVPWALISHGVAEKLFTVNEEGELVGQVGQNVTKVDENNWRVSLKPGYLFSDGTLVDAEHVATSLSETNQKNTHGNASLGTMTVTAADDLTVQIS
jgi:peptide/nickel transport system substrate-binding protein